MDNIHCFEAYVEAGMNYFIRFTCSRVWLFTEVQGSIVQCNASNDASNEKKYYPRRTGGQHRTIYEIQSVTIAYSIFLKTILSTLTLLQDSYLDTIFSDFFTIFLQEIMSNQSVSFSN